ncbi:nuclear transport factor 2 family protein [Nocardioides sp. CPCC 205120]|uniref:nuclear transport factor 2 family protein n=1 Tax=Nocardioides sp. CPCC 205120 TaxID=3406462 RepID=UPI003B503523
MPGADPVAGGAAVAYEHRAEIDDLLNRYAHAYDDRDAAGVGATFAEDGELSLTIAGGDLVGPFVGREAIIAMMTGALAGQDDQRRHVASTLALDACDGTAAEARSYLTLVTIVDGALSVVSTARYSDRLRRVDGRWLLARRHIALDLPY